MNNDKSIYPTNEQINLYYQLRRVVIQYLPFLQENTIQSVEQADYITDELLRTMKHILDSYKENCSNVIPFDKNEKSSMYIDTSWSE